MTDVGLCRCGRCIVKEILLFAFVEFLSHLFKHLTKAVLFPLVLVPRSLSFYCIRSRNSFRGNSSYIWCTEFFCEVALESHARLKASWGFEFLGRESNVGLISVDLCHARMHNRIILHLITDTAL